MAARGSAPVGGSAPIDISDAFVTPTSSLSTERFASHRDWEPKNAPLCHCGLSVGPCSSPTGCRSCDVL